jgi:hypothetical protein
MCLPINKDCGRHNDRCGDREKPPSPAGIDTGRFRGDCPVRHGSPGQEMLKRAFPRIIHLFQGWRTVQAQMFVDDFLHFRFAMAHDWPPEESLIHFLNRALARYKVTAIVPRDFLNSLAIWASL